MADTPAPITDTPCHATAVDIDGAGVLLTGPSGSGKSALAIELIALGARLIADDVVPLALEEGHPQLCPPPRLAGVIEARGVGLIRVPATGRTPLRLVVAMEQQEEDRLPQSRVIEVLGVPIPLIYRASGAQFAAALFLLAKGGRHA